MSNPTPRLDASVLHFHAKPYPRFWLPDGKLRPVVRTRLLKIADAYLTYLNLPAGVKVKDITLTGSLTGRNYTTNSDVDIHLLVDYERVAGSVELVGEFFDLKRKDWSANHPITVYGFPVELYAQDLTQFEADGAGHYSLRQDKWVHPVPEPVEERIDDKAALALARTYAKEAVALLALKSPTAQLPAIRAFLTRFRALRQRGLTSKGGLYSPENLAFKILRNSGSLDQVWTAESRLQAQALTLTESLIPNSPMKTPIIRINESQVPVLQAALHAHNVFLKECAEMGNMLTEGDMLEESVMNSLGEKFKSLFQQGGPVLLRKSIMAAVLGGSLLLSSEAIADTARSAGLDQAQVTQLQRDVEAAKPSGEANAPGQAAAHAKALTQLHQRYVVDNADAKHQRQFMKFTGNLADVVGIGENGYPLFAPGSPSQLAFDQAFLNPQPVTGIVNAPDGNGGVKDFAGRFVLANGLWYNLGNGQPTDDASAGAGSSAAASSAASSAAATPGAPSSPVAPAGNQASANGGGYMFDFSGLFAQARGRFLFKKRADGVVTDNIVGKVKRYTDFTDYAADFVRASGHGLEGYSDQQITDLFANGVKVRLNTLPPAK